MPTVTWTSVSRLDTEGSSETALAPPVRTWFPVPPATWYRDAVPCEAHVPPIPAGPQSPETERAKASCARSSGGSVATTSTVVAPVAPSSSETVRVTG